MGQRQFFTKYQRAWLAKHPERSREWLKAKLEEGFQVHHINGDHSDNAPENLVLIEALDHLRMHGIFGLKIFSSKRMSQIGSVGGLKSAAIAAKKRARSEINRANALKRYRKSSGDAAA